MKRLLAIILALMTLFSSSVGFATGAQTDKPINFSGYSFGETFKSMRGRTRLFCIDFLYGLHNARVVADALDIFAERDEFSQNRRIPSCFFARPSDVSHVAGHDCETELWFVYPFQNGLFRSDEDEAVFYAGVYEFFSWDDLPTLYAELQSKLGTLYGEPFYTGDRLDPLLGPMPIDASIIDWYNSDNAKYFPEYTVWKSSANGAMLVMSFWNDCNVNEYKLRLAYISNYAEEHFDQMKKLGVFGNNDSDTADYAMEGL